MKTSHLNALRALEAVLRNGSFSAAAAELNVSAAAIGQQIRQLESYLGRALFDRRPSGAIPTAEARRASERLTAGFAILSETLDALGRRRPENRVAVTLPESFAEHWFVRRLDGFFRDHGGVDLRLDSTNRRVDLLLEDFDYAIRYSPPPPDTLRGVDLFGDCVLPVCSPAFAERFALAPDAASLAGVPVIHLENRTPDPDWADWPRWGAAFGVAAEGLTGGASLSRFSSGLHAAVAGQALVLAGLVEAWSALEDGLLVAPFGRERRLPTSYRYRLVFAADRARSPVQRRFERWVAGEAERFGAEVRERFGAA